MSEIKVDTIGPRVDNGTLTIGASGDTVNIAGTAGTGFPAGATLSGSTNNTVVTVTGANAMQGESSLTFDGTTLLSTSGASGATANSSANNIVADGNSASGNGISILSKNDSNGGIFFGDAQSNSRCIVKYDHSTDLFKIDTTAATAFIMNQDGIITKPLQPCFIVKAVSQTNVTGNGTSYNVAFTSEIKDVGGNFSGTTFTAPITGSYILTGHVDFQGGNNNITNTFLHFETSNRDFPVYTIKGGAGGGSGTQAGILYGTGNEQGMGLGGSCIADMDANDTVYLRLTVQGAGSDQCDITANNTIFTGCLLA